MPASDLKGDLLVEEQNYNTRMRQTRYYQYSLGVLVLGVILGLVAFYLRFFVSAYDMLIGALVVLCVTVAYIAFLISLYLYLLGRMRLGIKVYKNGVAYPTSLGFREVFYPFAEFKSMEKEKNFLYGDVYVLKFDSFKALYIRQKTLDLDNYMEFINKQIKSPREVTEVDIYAQKRDFRRAELIWYAIALGFGLSLASLIIALSLSDWSWFLFFFVLGILGPVLTNTALFIMGMRLIMDLRSQNWGFGINLKLIGAIFVVSLVAFMGASYAGSVYSLGMNETQIVEYAYPGTSALNGTYYEKMDLELSGNVTLLSGSLTIKDSNIVFNCTHDRQLGIWTAKGTMLKFQNVTIRPKDLTCTYFFEIHGSARIGDCIISHPWGDTRTEKKNGDGGVKVFNSDVVINDTLITGGESNGLLIVDCSPRILNNTIERCGDDGIELQNSGAYIYGNWIQYNDWGMTAFNGSNARIQNNAFVENNNAISLVDSSLVITDNHFINNKAAIEKGNSPDTVIRDNEFIGKNDVTDATDTVNSLLQVCVVVIFISTAISYGMLYFANRKVVGPPKAPKRKKI